MEITQTLGCDERMYVRTNKNRRDTAGFRPGINTLQNTTVLRSTTVVNLLSAQHVQSTQM
jgi:hypothetical protein